MGIFDDMENFLFDRFSVTKRHNVQHRVISISSNSTSANGHQQQQQQQPDQSPPRNQRLSTTELQQDHGSTRQDPIIVDDRVPSHSHSHPQQQGIHHLSHQQLQRQQQQSQRNHPHQHHPHHHHHHQQQQQQQQQQLQQQQQHHHHQAQQHHHNHHQQQQHHSLQQQQQQQQQLQMHEQHQQQQCRQNPHKQLQRCSSYPQAPQQQQQHHPPPVPRSHSRQDMADYTSSRSSPHSSLPNSPPTVPRTGTGGSSSGHVQMTSARTENSPSSHRRSPQVNNHSRIPSSSPFRDRMSWHESRSRPPTGYTELHSPQQEHRGFPSPARSRHRASWVELSNLAGSFDFSTPSSSPHPLRRSASSSSPSSKPDSPTSSAMYNNVNNNNLSRPPSTGPLSSIDRDRDGQQQPVSGGFHSRRTMSSTSLTARSPSSERPPTPFSSYDNNNRTALPPSPSSSLVGNNKAPPKLDSPTSPQKQNLKNEKTISLPSTFRSEPQLASLDRPACMVAGDGDLPQFGLPTQQTQQPNGVVITKICRPKLVRLRSEPSSPFSSHSGGSGSASSSSAFVAVDPQSPQSAIRCRRRRRDELKRSQSLEVTSSGSCQEELWTGINVPNQLVITRPQLSRADVNRRHMSLHLDCTNGGSGSSPCCAPDSFSCMSGDSGSGRAYPPLMFHDTHGDNIQLLNNKARARRHESFCKGICYSNRPVLVNEKIYVKFVETNTSWSGVLRFGYTSIDPASIQGQDLPRYACPDLTNKPGNWAKALGERYTTSNILLHFSVNESGDVAYGVNGEDKGVFFTNVITTGKLWAMLDVYGNTVTVEFSNANAAFSEPEPNTTLVEVPRHQPRSLEDLGFSSMSMETPTSSLSGPPSGPPLRYHAGINFTPLPMHPLQGRNIRFLGEGKSVAARLESEYCNSLIFSNRPMTYGETVIIQILSVDRSYMGGLGFGLTACNPNDVDPSSLPDDSDYLLDRLEYWVVNKDVCSTPEIGDELSFYLTNEGEVIFSRNGQPVVTLMHVDRTLPLWVFFDVYGNVQKIKILGCTMTPVHYGARPAGGNNRGMAEGAGGLSVAMPSSSSSSGSSASSSASSQNRRNQGGPQPPHLLNLRSNSEPEGGQPREKASPGQPSSVPATPAELVVDPQDEDCHVCYEQRVNCVIYKCGHMCLCFSCADQIQRQKGQCPICRSPITDIIKVFRS